MGAKPVLATIAFGVGPDTGEAWILECYRGIAALAERAQRIDIVIGPGFGHGAR